MCLRHPSRAVPSQSAAQPNRLEPNAVGGQPVGLGLQSLGEGGTLSWAGSHQQKCLSPDCPEQCRDIEQAAKGFGIIPQLCFLYTWVAGAILGFHKIIIEFSSARSGGFLTFSFVCLFVYLYSESSCYYQEKSFCPGEVERKATLLARPSKSGRIQHNDFDIHPAPHIHVFHALINYFLQIPHLAGACWISRIFCSFPNSNKLLLILHHIFETASFISIRANCSCIWITTKDLWAIFPSIYRFYFNI